MALPIKLNGRPHKLSAEVREEIRRIWAAKPSLKSLAAQYDCSTACICDILNPKTRDKARQKSRQKRKRTVSHN